MKMTGGETDIGWRTELIAKRGRRIGLVGPDLDDAMQEITPHVLKFQFDSTRSNGASLRTALISIIDRQLLAFRRREGRYAKRLRQARENYQLLDTQGRAVEPSCCDVVPLVTDVQSAVGRLDEIERKICALLSHGCSVQEIALDLSLDWHSVNRRIQRIRDRFRQLGLNAWLDAA